MIGSFRLTQIGEFQPTRIGVFRPTQFGEFHPTRTTSLSIGNNAKQDNSKWIKAKIITDDPLKFQDYVSSLSTKPEFKDVSIPQFNTDTSSGYKTAEMTIAKGKVGE